MIEIRDLCVSKSGRAICSVPELRVSVGDRVVIVGPNGSGKTTLMRVLAGLETDYHGDCQVSLPWNERVYIHQAPYLFRGTVLSNVTYGLRQRGFSRAECDESALHWLDRFGLRGMASDAITHLSGGERRRVALARGMILRPRLLLLDEPLADMDKAGTDSVVSAIAELEQATILIASPSMLSSELTTKEFRLPCV